MRRICSGFKLSAVRDGLILSISDVETPYFLAILVRVSPNLTTCITYLVVFGAVLELLFCPNENEKTNSMTIAMNPFLHIIRLTFRQKSDF